MAPKQAISSVDESIGIYADESQLGRDANLMGSVNVRLQCRDWNGSCNQSGADVVSLVHGIGAIGFRSS